MIGYISYSGYRRSKLLIGKRVEFYCWVFLRKESCHYWDIAKVSFESKDVDSEDPKDQSFYVNHLTLIELV